MGLASPNNAITKTGPLHGHCVGPLAHTVRCEQQRHMCVDLRTVKSVKPLVFRRKNRFGRPEREGSLQRTASHYSFPLCRNFLDFSTFLVFLFDVPLLLPFSFVSNGLLSICLYLQISFLLYFFSLLFSFCLLS
jgi:hypothetical protein